MKKHNGVISLWKFLFCMMIVIFHGTVFSTSSNDTLFFETGAIGVEFFFIVSGYLMARKALNLQENVKNIGKETINYIWKKIKLFYPYIIIGYLGSLLAILILGNMPIRQILFSLYEVLLIKSGGFKGPEVNGAIWYLSSMLLCMMVLYPLIRKYKYNFIYIACPLIVLFLAGYLNQEYTSLRSPSLWTGIFYKGTIRAFMELCLGAAIYPISERIKRINFTKIGEYLLTIIEVACFLVPFVLSQFVKSARIYDFIVMFIIAIGVTIAFSEKTIDQKVLNNKFVYYLEKLSLPIYLLHLTFMNIIENSEWLLTFGYYKLIVGYVIIVVLYSALVMFIVESCRKKKYLNFKSIFIK